MASRSKVRAALASVEAADVAACLADLPGLLLPELMSSFGAESVLWTELDETAGSPPSRVVIYPEPLLDQEVTAALEQHAPGFALTRHTRPGGDGRPVRRSDLQSMQSFRGSGMYADVAHKLGVDQMLATALTPGGGLHVCISLNRAGLDFTSGICSLSSGRCWPAGWHGCTPTRSGRRLTAGIPGLTGLCLPCGSSRCSGLPLRA